MTPPARPSIYLISHGSLFVNTLTILSNDRLSSITFDWARVGPAKAQDDPQWVDEGLYPAADLSQNIMGTTITIAE